MQGVKRNCVMLLPHDNAWDSEFVTAKLQIEEIWGDNVLDVQHIGSTSIYHICAKPILDMAVVLQSFARMSIEAMTNAEYEYRGPQNPEKSRYLFILRDKNDLSLRHLHCYEPDDENYRMCVGFRDYLNNHPQEAA